MSTMPTRMKPIAVLFLMLGHAVPAARGQEEGFRYATPKTTTKVAKAAPVIKPAAAPQVVMTIEVSQDGSGYAKDENYVVGIESVVLYTDRMRWMFYLKNKGDRGYATNVVGAKTYVADLEAETYKPLDMQYKPNGDGYRRIVVQGGTKERFWFDFPIPRKPTDTFKVGLGVDDFLLAGIPFKPFTVKLVEPIGAGSAPKATKAPEPLGEGGTKPEEIGGFGPDRPGGMTREPERWGEAAPKPSGEAAQAVLAAPRDGRRYEGSIQGRE